MSGTSLVLFSVGISSLLLLGEFAVPGFCTNISIVEEKKAKTGKLDHPSFIKAFVWGVMSFALFMIFVFAIAVTFISLIT